MAKRGCEEVLRLDKLCIAGVVSVGISGGGLVVVIGGWAGGFMGMVVCRKDFATSWVG